MPDQDSQTPTPQPLLAQFDAWMAGHPWHPRLLPYLAYVAFLPVVGVGRDWAALAHPLLYCVQCGLVMWLLWRYRRHLPELNLRFHWLAVPVGVLVVVVWLWLGHLVTHWSTARAMGLGSFTGDLAAWVGSARPDARWQAPDNARHYLAVMPDGVRWTTLALRLIGMSLVVPLCEELFIRSLLLRSFHSARRTAIGLVQVVQDLPLIGEWLLHTHLGKRASRHPPVFGEVFQQTPLGALSLFGVLASTALFTAAHNPRDYLGCVFCGLAYCLLVWATNRPGAARGLGLGPVVWAHGITNALLWAYTLHTGDWQFL